MIFLLFQNVFVSLQMNKQRQTRFYMRNKWRNNVFLLTLLLMSHLTIGQTNLSFDDSSQPVWQWRCERGEAFLNFNPATIIDSSKTIMFDSIPYASNYTMVVVYKPVLNLESSVWKLTYDDGIRGLTTEHIISNGTLINYSDTTTVTPIINALRQSAPDSTSPFVRLTLGGDINSGSVKVSEILYFDHRLSNSTLRKVQSALAIRYGVTLGPVDYEDGNGNMIWHYKDNARYHHRITGVGRDSTYHIHQLYSRSECDGSMLTISTDTLPEGSFLLCGDNNAPLSFETNGDIEVLNREWKIGSNYTENNYYHLTFDTHTFNGTNDSLVLLVDGNAYFPDTNYLQGVTYRYIMFPSDTSVFTLAKGASLWQMSASNGKGGSTPKYYGENVKPYIYPNPSTGDYTIEVSGALWVNVTIYDTQGRIMENYGDSNKSQYLFKGMLPSGNTYYATVTTENGTQSLKLVVQ